MSMKRSKQRGSGGREKELDANFWNKPQQPEMTWEQATEGKPDDAFMPYSMTQAYAKGQLVSHPKFGKGVIVGVEPARVEILFQDGKKKLGHNQS